jgi:glycosyl transferase, family 25
MNASLLAAFDRIAIINLPDRPDRRREVTAELKHCGVAVDGERVRFVEAIRPEGPGGFPSTGAHGCFLSHLKTLRQAQVDGVQRLLVLEDDVMFLPELGRAAHLAPMLAQDNWHLAYPGHVRPALPGPLRWTPSSEPLVCAHCYAVHVSAIPGLVAFLEACLARPAGHPDGGPMHVDGALSVWRRQRPDLITWVASASLAGQRSSRSDIIGPSWLDRWLGTGLAGWVRALRNRWRRRGAGA